MKILCIHADFIEFEAKKKAFKGAEEGIKEGKHRVDECLVIFSAVEKEDEKDISAVLERYEQEIINIAKQVNAKNIVLYPYAHLSSSLAAPSIAEQFLKDAEKKLADKFTVSRAPFGWYKSFNISCKGHPLSELSRQFSAEKSLKREAKDESFEMQKKVLDRDEKRKLTAAYLTAAALKERYPELKVGSAGFYHDQAYIDVDIKLKQEDIPRVEDHVKRLLGNPLKAESIKEVHDTLQQDIKEDLGQAAIYKLHTIEVVPLFKEPFVAADDIRTYKILNIASAYWKNNENNAQLTRIYCIAFGSDAEMHEYLLKQEEAQKRSHLKIGKEQGLFIISELVGSGLPLLAPKGTLIRNEVVQFLTELHKGKGYSPVAIPHIAKDLLYKKSGHWEKFGDELFHVKGQHDQFVLKPMNCPHHIQIYDAFSYSYRDLPVRFFEPTTVYRDEKPGQLAGLSRVRSITQDDGHIFCRISQIKQEVKTIVGIILQFYKTLGMDKGYWVSLSVRGEDQSKYLGDPEVWNNAESALEDVAKDNLLPFRKIPGEAAFYGPKLDFIFKDALEREWQLATIQLDFNLPERFQLSYMNEESKKERPVMIHRAISGSLERFMSILIEHFAGRFPVWLSPVQIKILTISDKHNEYARQLQQKMQALDLRVEVDDRTETMNRKVRDAQQEQANYILTVGDKEVESQTLAVRTRSGDTKFGVPAEEFIKKIVAERDSRSL